MPFEMKRVGMTAVVAAGLAAAAAAARGGDLAARVAARNTIVDVELKTHAAVLANDTFEGRLAGSRGGRAAAGYLVEQFRKLGLSGGGVDGAYTQPFDRECRNLLAVCEGSDPELKHEYVLVGAHYDHVGYGNARNSFGPFGFIHNGADDNASGVAALLEIAQSLKSVPVHTKRSLLFAFWDSEEQGLFGSKHWLAHPTVNLRRVRAAINVDMIGRMSHGRLNVIGSRTGYGFRKLITRGNFESALELEFPWEILADSDHHPFFRSGIPVVMFHTGKHSDYHRPSDDVEKLNLAGMQAAARLLFDVAVDLADADEPPTFRSASLAESVSERQREAFERPLAPPPGRFGIRWKSYAAGENGLLVTFVQSRTAASRAGLRPGDRLLACDGDPLTSDEQLQKIIARSSEALRLTVLPLGAEQPGDLVVTLDGSPSRVGLSWIADDAEPGTVIIKRVLAASPAERAGLKTADRILAIDGREFESGEAFEQALSTSAEALTLTVERGGVWRDVRLAVDP